MTSRRGSGELGDGRSVLDLLKDALLTGLALTIPVAVTLFLIAFVVRFLASILDPAVASLAATLGLGTDLELLAGYLLALGILVLALLILGLAAETAPGRRIERTVIAAIEAIPGIGAVYGSFNEMSELLFDSDTQSFQEVVLVEYPTEGSYSVAFLTADAPDVVLESTGHDEMQTVFMPMAPNPVMGGFVLYISAERVHQVDMSVEEGIQSIVTSGVAVGEEEHQPFLEERDDESTPAGGPTGAA